MKKINLVLASAVILGLLAGCSSSDEKAAEYIANADALLDGKNFEKAAIEYKNALQINQNLPDAWYGLARIHDRKQDWTSAVRVLSRIRDTNPNHMNGRIMLAQILLASNQIDQALEDANHLLEIAPQDGRVHSLMAAVQLRLGNLEAANESVERALSLDPGSSEAILVKARLQIAEQNFDQAIDTLDTALKTQPDNASLYLMKIKAYTELGDDSAVNDVYKALVKNFPENTAFKHAFIRRHLQLGDIDQAERLLEQIVEENPDRIEAKKRLVGFKNQHRSVDETIALIRNYIEQDRKEYQYRFVLGELYLSHKKIDEAIDVYQGIITDDGVQPNGLEARIKLANIYLRAGRTDEARVLVDEVLTNDKFNENALLLQAGFKIAGAQYDDAIVDLRIVLRDNPKSIKALVLTGKAYTALGSTELAIESYGKAFELSPHTPAIANEYAAVLMRKNSPAQADEVLLRSMKAGNQSVQAIMLLTQVKLMLGEWDFAEELAQQLKGVEGQEAVSEQVLGIVYQGREQSAESIDAFKRAHELAPDAAQPVIALVQTLINNNKHEEARQFLEKIVSDNENNVTANLLLAQLSLKEQDIPAAVDYYNQVIQINPKLEISYSSLAAIYVRDRKLNDAERVLMDGLTEIPGNTALSVKLATVYELQAKFDEAINVYEELLQKNPDLIVAKNNLASMLTDHRKDQESFDRARQLASEFRSSEVPQFRDTYAWASVKARADLDQAVAILEEIVRENENVGIYRYHLGEALMQKGDVKNAKIHLKKVLELEKEGSRVAARAKKGLE